MTTQQTKTVWLTGASGFIGTHVADALRHRADLHVLTPRRAEVDLTDVAVVSSYLERHRPDVVIHLAAAAAGSVQMRRRPVHYGLANLRSAEGLLAAVERGVVPRLLVAGSAGEYPRLVALGESPRGLVPSDLWRGAAAAGGYGQARRLISQWSLDAAKGAGTEAAVLVLPTVYGPGDGGPPPLQTERLRALPSFAMRMMTSSAVEHWGSGFEQRDFVHVKDVAEAFVAAIDAPIAGMRLHISDGRPVQMQEIARQIADVLGFRGRQRWQHRIEAQQHSEDRVWLEPAGLPTLGFSPQRQMYEELGESLDDLRRRLEVSK